MKNCVCSAASVAYILWSCVNKHDTRQLMLSQQRASFFTQLVFCISFEGQKQLTEKAKLLLATAAMVILICFH